MRKLWYSPVLINFWSRSTEFMQFSSLWLVEQFPCICRRTTHRIGLKFGGQTHYGTLQVWLTFSHAPLNSRCYLACDWSSSFRAFADEPLIGLGSNLVVKSVMGLPRSDQLLVMLYWIHAVSWPLIGGAVSMQLQMNRWSDWAQIWWANSLWTSLGLINFWSCSAKFPPFPGLWLVEQFLCICKRTADWIELKFGGQTRYGPPPA